MQPLDKTYRNLLERKVKEARDIGETAAKAVLAGLGVGENKPFGHLDDAERHLRRRLRAHGRQLGDRRKADGEQEISRLLEEVAYEHWHRMLFARFLAENDLLMYPDPDDPVAISLEECEDLAADEGAENGWELAARYASQMLPQIFRLDSPIFELSLPPEHQQQLEHLLSDLPVEVFTASDSLGWVYQFWQAKKKDEVNASEVKIGARELPAVTQLFTEPYMVSFLLDNSLGAWWCQKSEIRSQRTEGGESEVREKLQSAKTEEELREFFALPGVPLEYLRFIKEKAPAKSEKSIMFPLTPGPSGRGAGGEGEKRLPADILKYARELRKNQTDAEQLLWKLLRGRRFLGKKFRRQHPVGRYILDFYCHDEKLAIELDGGQHNEPAQEKKDKKRSKILEDKGIKVLRFWNNEVLQQTESVLEALYFALSPSLPSPQTPLPEGEGLSPAKLGDYEECWRPAAGTFSGWPDNLAELKALDPCCGSGHFLVAAFLMLVPMRMELEGLSAREAVDAVLRDNIHGLELDQRCVELAAFALALTAWKYPALPSPSGRGAGGEGPIGYRPLPDMHLACSGLSVSVAKEEWKQLALEKKNLRIALDWLYEEFKNAPVLGSLLNPAKGNAAKLIDWQELGPMLEEALAKEQGDDQQEMGVVAHGLAKAAGLLAGKYHWVITNVPYLARGKQSDTLKDFCEKNYNAAKNDIATVFLDRCLEFCHQSGTANIVLPQNWLFLTSYKKFREKLLRNDTWNLIARLGPRAFETISGEVVKAILLTINRGKSIEEAALLKPNQQDVVSTFISGLDVSEQSSAQAKAEQLPVIGIKRVEQDKQLVNPDARVTLDENGVGKLFQQYGYSYHGLTSGDMSRMKFCFWEIIDKTNVWIPFQSTVNSTLFSGGNEAILRWQNGKGAILELLGARKDGTGAWEKPGILVSQMGELSVTLYNKFAFDNNTAVIVPTVESHLPAIWCFCSSPKYNKAVRQIDQSLKVTNATLVKVPFDLAHWTKIAKEKYPNGLPKPYSNDPTQWIFHGHPANTDHPLQVAIARLLGYRWPAELDTEMELSEEQRTWVQKCDVLLPLADDDGIVCIPPIRGEAAASDRLQNLLAAAFNQSLLPSPSGRGAGGEGWSTDTLAALLTAADHKGNMETWLRDKFFAQHCKLFHHRPFIWHIWDGLHDGFAALINYHKLDHKTLETLIYTYLGDWISRQKDDIASGVDSAQEKLAAAQNLKKKLELILEGESPHDIFVRWKPIHKQPIGWNPDLNDGVRLNIRPFLTVGDVKKKDAGLFPFKPNIKWGKDRGKDVPSAPWYKLGLEYGGKEGDRINDHHLKLAEKLNASSDHAKN